MVITVTMDETIIERLRKRNISEKNSVSDSVLVNEFIIEKLNESEDMSEEEIKSLLNYDNVGGEDSLDEITGIAEANDVDCVKIKYDSRRF